MSTYKGFTTVELRKPTRSVFDLSHEKRISFKMGQLIPCFISEVIPNDTFRVTTEMMLRFAPMLAPIMHRVNVFIHFFFIPNRHLWREWEKFITNGRLGTETPPVPPYLVVDQQTAHNMSLFDNGSLWDYLGGSTFPDSAGSALVGRTLDVMPFLAYNKVWEDYYRDRNYVGDTVNLPIGSGENGNTSATTIRDLIQIKYRDYQKDYFTSALPWTQRGNEVLMPLVGSGTVSYLPSSIVKRTDGAAFTSGNRQIGSGTAATSSSLIVNQLSTDGSGGTAGRIENIDTVDINSSGVSINDLRRSVRLQEWLERNALAGSRYNESILAHFARRTSDKRIQRAEYLGGGKSEVRVSEIVTTAWSVDGDTNNVPPANMAGHGISFGNSNGFTYNAEEHGFIVGIMSCMPNTSYMQGIPRMFIQRNTFLDYPWPSFAHLGEQQVYKYELMLDPATWVADRNQNAVFGYQSRYADWKYIPSSSHGDFRDSLDHWHLTRKFSSSPVLGSQFCTFDPTLPDRIFAVSGVQTLWGYLYNNVTVKRSLPYHGTPKL